MGLSFSGVYNEILYQLGSLLRAPNANQLVILMYHGVIRSPLKVYDWCFINESSFLKQVKYLKKHIEVIPLPEAVERLSKGTKYQPTAAITFDDGFQNNYDIAFPILREAKIPATIFLVTGLVDASDTVWFCRLNRALAVTNKISLEWNDDRFDLSGLRSKVKTLSSIKEKLKEFAYPRLLTELRNIVLELGDDPDRQIEVDSPFRILNHNAIEEMAASGVIHFGAHTHSHAILSLLSEQERHDEITRSITAVKGLTGSPCELFAYPNGRAQDYDPEIIKILESCGVRVAVTAIEGPNDEGTPLMELRRYGMGANLSLVKFKRKVRV